MTTLRFDAGLIATIAMLALTSTAHAISLTPDVSTVGWTRGDANTTYQFWDVFTNATGANAPDVDENAVGTASLVQTVPAPMGPTTGPFLTGGNIYSFATVTNFIVTVPDFGNSGNFTRVVAQWETLGTELDTTSILLDGLVPDLWEELSRVPDPGPNGGDRVERLAIWDLTDNPGLHTLTFGSSSTSLSLDKFSVDTANGISPFPALEFASSVPEPMSIGLAGAGLLGWLLFATRRRRQRK